MRRPVYRDISPDEMRRLREVEGLTNKQIAERCGCSVPTVYAYIGKRSDAVVNARAQNKPLPVPAHIAIGGGEATTDGMDITGEDTHGESIGTVMLDASHVSTLSVLEEVRMIQLSGSECQYEVNTGDKTVTVRNGAVEVIMFDKESLTRFIGELNEIAITYLA